jgi:asparagine synthase (glutamine-hydrolysing)
LRRWLDQALPEAGAFAPKRGFTVPVAEWIHAEGAKLGPLVAAQPGIAEVAEPGAVAKLFRDPRKHAGFAAWTLLFYALWHRHHIEGKPDQGDVFACLTN